LGRKVVVLPCSSKFFNQKYPPVYATAFDWTERAKEATTNPEALEDSRQRNQTFYERLVYLLDQ